MAMGQIRPCAVDSTPSTPCLSTFMHSQTTGNSQIDQTHGHLSFDSPLWQRVDSDAYDVLSQIDNYVAVGCLVPNWHSEPRQRSHPTVEWHEIGSLGPDSDFAPTLARSITILLQAGWIRVFHALSHDSSCYIYRIHLLPQDVGLRHIERTSRKLSAALESILLKINTSSTVWNGQHLSRVSVRFDAAATAEPGSLFYQFNKLTSPDPCVQKITERYDREALEDLLQDGVFGLRTSLYPYQRRSAGAMLQRESVTVMELDPRLEVRSAADGRIYYYDAWNVQFYKMPRYYESSRGGILAESMGLGKTVICLALILATKNFLPRMPASYALRPVRPCVGSLADMAVSSIHRSSMPWKIEFERLFQASGTVPSAIVNRLSSAPATYEIPHEPLRLNRRTMNTSPPPRVVTMAATTVIVVPRNLCKQWESEICKHVGQDALKVLIMDDSRRALPEPDVLCSYDVLLFSRNRFELEDKDGADHEGRRIMQSKTNSTCSCTYIGSSRVRDCHCLHADAIYDSPLKRTHFKRLIIDEGHFFGNNNRSVASSVAEKLVTADHCWVVSGTPARDLLGVEVDFSISENMNSSLEVEDMRNSAVQQRKDFSDQDQKGAIESLGHLASGILRIKPWSERSENAKWRDHVFRHEKTRQHTNSSFSPALRRFLESVVIKTRPEDVERDISIPALKSSVVRLQPSFYDKLTANIFVSVLTANAVTSERADADYIFHKSSQKARTQLITNLRQSAFFWTGFSEGDVIASVKNSREYINRTNAGCSPDDRLLLMQAMSSGQTISETPGWVSMSRSHEVGIFLDDFPEESAEHWSFNGSTHPLMTGISQLMEAQTFVNQQLDKFDPGEGLSGAGIKTLASLRASNAASAKDVPTPELSLAKAGIPASSVDAEPIRKRRATSTSQKNDMKSKIKKARNASSDHSRNTVSNPTHSATLQPCKTADSSHAIIPARYARTKIIGTASAKLSYLISQIVKYYREEKILVFYQGENSAFYIAQMLDLLNIKHEIYAKSLKASMKADYVVHFNESDEQRVLLMDVYQAAFGLNLSSASRIYFVNPVCRPNVEAQAVKRAHRIGQTRTVHVETLVLEGSIEEKMLERSRRMTNVEHNNARSLEDDGGIREIIQTARLMPITAEELASEYAQMAPLEEAQQLWGVGTHVQQRPNDTDLSTKEVGSQPAIAGIIRAKPSTSDASSDGSVTPSANKRNREIDLACSIMSDRSVTLSEEHDCHNKKAKLYPAAE